MWLLTRSAVAEKTMRSGWQYPGEVTATVVRLILNFPHLKREIPFHGLRRSKAPGSFNPGAFGVFAIASAWHTSRPSS